MYAKPYRRATCCMHRQWWEEEVTNVRQQESVHCLVCHNVTITDQIWSVMDHCHN